MNVLVSDFYYDRKEFVVGGMYTEKPLDQIDCTMQPEVWLLVREAYTENFVWVNLGCEYAMAPMPRDEAEKMAKGMYYQPDGMVRIMRRATFAKS